MKRAVSIETDDPKSNTVIESIVADGPQRMSDNKTDSNKTVLERTRGRAVDQM